MGVCSSCLGRSGGRDRDLSDEDESSRLLFDDPHGHHYGSFADQHVGIPQADPQEVQRETEALQKVVAQTSNHLVDIFAMIPQNGQNTASVVLPSQDAKILRYQDVLAKMAADDQSIKAEPLSADNTPNPSKGWLSVEDDVEEMKNYTPVKSEGIGALLGGFADPDSIME
ncbi:late endosomal/lysosomal adaptor and MAPK and MTOR activator-domain-containing protein [Amylocarpus encephaloides]|uniref:Late endosomal/lysosomal adaptor and MAPK and MTOR activator-domain-containing protein n=1 Tax=Amylocarpus encephaloides TaxID=45428 RepID=A0A9P7YGF1_9HELO|nr:late endosomal/lysosomal adaptor and MAPK and MTOR activator-domain-containing protein [Amylocarpus encephaloides]